MNHKLSMKKPPSALIYPMNPLTIFSSWLANDLLFIIAWNPYMCMITPSNHVQIRCNYNQLKLPYTNVLIKLTTSTCKVGFNIDNQTIHLTLNIPIQQTLTNISKLSLDSLNKITCWYGQLHWIVINEISLVNVIMFNVIDNLLKARKHI